MQKKLRALLLFITCTTCCWSAQPDPSAILTIPELLDIALENNPETQTAWWYAKKAAAGKRASEALYYPTLSLSGAAMHGRDYQFAEGRIITYTTAGTELALSYLLYDFGERRALYEVAKANLNAARWELNRAMQHVIYEVMNHAYLYLNAKEVLDARMNSLKDAMIALEAAEELNRIGLRCLSDVYTLRATISETRMAISVQKAEADVALGRLATSLGLDPNTALNIASLPDNPAVNQVNCSLNELIAQAKDRRADLLAKRAYVAQKQEMRAKVKAQYLPKITFDADTGYQRYVDDKANGFNYNLGVFFNMPLYTGGEATAQLNAADAEWAAAQSELEQKELAVAQEVLTYHRRFESAQELLILSEEYLQNAHQTFSGVLDRYKAGTQSIFDLSFAQRQLAEARIKHEESKTAWYRNLAELAYAMGTISTEEQCTNTPSL